MSFPGTLRLGRVWSVPVLLSPGVVVTGVVLVLLVGPRLDRGGFEAPWLVAAVAVASLYASVLLHELAHVGAARHHGLLVRSVRLHLLGGETLVESESRSPRQELVVAAVGPLASAGIGGVALAVAVPLGDGDASQVLAAIGWINLLVAAFNLLPALPLDGGRVLRALAWWVSGREAAGIVFAAWCGRLAAVASLALGAWLLGRDSPTAWLDLALCVVVALFMWQGSSQSLRAANRAERVAQLSAQRLLDSTVPEAEWPRLPVGLTGAALLRAMNDAPAANYAVVDQQGRVLGTLRTRTVNRAYRVGARR